MCIQCLFVVSERLEAVGCNECTKICGLLCKYCIKMVCLSGISFVQYPLQCNNWITNLDCCWLLVFWFLKLATSPISFFCLLKGSFSTDELTVLQKWSSVLKSYDQNQFCYSYMKMAIRSSPRYVLAMAWKAVNCSGLLHNFAWPIWWKSYPFSIPQSLVTTFNAAESLHSSLTSSQLTISGKRLSLFCLNLFFFFNG